MKSLVHAKTCRLKLDVIRASRCAEFLIGIEIDFTRPMLDFFSRRSDDYAIDDGTIFQGHIF